MEEINYIKECLLKMVSRKNPNSLENANEILDCLEDEDILIEVVQDIDQTEKFGILDDESKCEFTPTEKFYELLKKARKEAEKEIEEEYDTADFYRSLAVESRMW